MANSESKAGMASTTPEQDRLRLRLDAMDARITVFPGTDGTPEAEAIARAVNQTLDRMASGDYQVAEPSSAARC